jgi:uncharacterized RDD family membrane protein YckC
MQSIKVRTTQNVLIDYPVAGVFDRILAFLLDMVILIAYLILVISVSALHLGVDQWLLVILYLPFFFYNLIFEIAMHGQTLGKRVLAIRVVRLDGEPPTIGNYVLRWILWPVDVLFSGSIAVTCILFTENGQRLGDIASGTTVIKLINPGALTGQKIIQDLKEDYQPQFPQVIYFSEKDISVIKEALDVNQVFGNTMPIDALSGKIQSLHGISTDLPPVTFLRTVLKDYHYLSSSM